MVYFGIRDFCARFAVAVDVRIVTDLYVGTYGAAMVLDSVEWYSVRSTEYLLYDLGINRNDGENEKPPTWSYNVDK